ncbi:sulfotransferase family protein [Nocardiopsis sp. NPDC101807]|uniref:sulfotransferase family protein n=1 Tax=Nocardiopsis sp. NPDC101807 TaxID=3364339 RepID=UPI003810D41E
MNPVLLGGENRSGTTLLSIVLNSHPDLCVGPELDFVEPPNLGTHVLEAIELVRSRDPRAVGPGTSSGDPYWYDAAHFVKQCERFGIGYAELAGAIRARLDQGGGNLVTLPQRCELIRALSEARARAQGARMWGIKLQRKIRDVDEFARIWPRARFIHIVRDGRDVITSHLHTVPDWGHQDVETAARDWVEIISFARHRAPSGRYLEVRYEDLVSSPEPVTRRMCDFLGVGWSARMVRHHELEHPLHRNPWSHPAAEKTKARLTRNSVGRFRRELGHTRTAQYESVAGDLLADCGYERSTGAPAR